MEQSGHFIGTSGHFIGTGDDTTAGRNVTILMENNHPVRADDRLVLVPTCEPVVTLVWD